MKRKLLIGILVVAVASPISSAQTCPTADQSPCVSPQQELPGIKSGQDVTITGDHFPASGIKVHLSTGRKNDKPLEREVTVQADGKALAFDGDVPRESYLVSVLIAGKELPVPGVLRVIADSEAQVKLTAIHPLTQYPNAISGDYDLVFVGENFSPDPKRNTIEVVGRGPESVITSDDCKTAFAAQSMDSRQPCLEVPKGLETRELKLIGFHPDKYSGPVKMQVRVGKNNVSDPATATMSRISSTAALLLSLVVFFLLSWIVIRLVSKGVKVYRIGDKSYGPITGFFLDKETNSYSLSKFQLLAWTAVSVFGYLYLFVCRLLVQWDFNFPPIPDNLPQLLAISAGTTVAATGITKAVGSKGAGGVQPSFSDFISTGGLVVGERFQFFVWTLVGCFVFFSLLLLKDPAAINELPKVPDGFLYLMGISSVGYLGGKAVRKPGPVIKLAAVTTIVPPGTLPKDAPPAATNRLPVLLINLKGENLGTDAKLQVDEHVYERADDFWVKGTPDPQTGFCTEVNIGIVDAEDYLDGDHVLTLINKDGQASSVNFPVDPLKIKSFAVESPAGQDPVLKVIGENYKTGMLFFTWTPEVGQPVSNVAIKDDQVKSETELQIPLKNNLADATGTGILTVTSKLGLRARKEDIINVPKIDSFIVEQDAAGNPKTLKVTGKTFSKGMKFAWSPTPPGAKVGPIGILDAQVISDSELQIPFTAAMKDIKGTGTLTVTNNLDLSGSKTDKI